MVTICTTSLTFSNSTFCPHSVFMCFVWISEQTAIISLYNINWLVFITAKEFVYCAVRTACLCKCTIILAFNVFAMAWAVIPRTRFIPWAVHGRLLMDKVAVGQVSVRVLRVFPRGVIPPMLLLTFICTLVSQWKQTVKSGNARQVTLFLKSGSVGWEKKTFACLYSSSDVIAPHRRVEWIFHPESETKHAFEIIVSLEMRKREIVPNPHWVHFVRPLETSAAGDWSLWRLVCWMTLT